MTCPHQPGSGRAPAPDHGARKALRPEEPDAPRVERQDAGGQPGVSTVWRIRGLEQARQVLRARHATTQAGFTAEAIPQGRLEHHPILVSDGPQHDEQRRKVARFLAPAVIERRYRPIMDRVADRAVAKALATGRCVLDETALHVTVEVTAELVGLTESAVPRLSRRLEAFFNQPPFDIARDDLGRRPRDWARAARNGLWPVVSLWWHDVRPAVRARRRVRRDDIISHLLDEGYSNASILVECVTYGTAGMVTTREFIVMAAWHLLTDEALLERYLAAEQPERLAILEEIIRLEPVVGHLYRRVRQPIEITDGDQTRTVPPGDLVDVCVRAANTDPAAVGADPWSLRPGRGMSRGTSGSALSFGDGEHTCPGRSLALLESDALLVRLLAHRPRLAGDPELGWDHLIEGYWLRGFALTFPGSTPDDGSGNE